MTFSRRLHLFGHFACDLSAVAAVLAIICLVSSSSCLSSPKEVLNTQTGGILHSSLLTDDLSLRSRRAPQRPPSVTSFQKAVKRPLDDNSTPSIRVVAPARETPDIPPHVRSQIESPHPPGDDDDGPRIVALNSPRARLPSSPYATSRKRPNHKPFNPRRKLILDLSLIQNDQDAIDLLKKKQLAKTERILQNELSMTEMGNDQKQPNVPSGHDVRGKKAPPIFRDLQSILKAIDMTYEELEKSLRKNNKSFLGFLDFVENGATLGDILDVLKVDEDQKSNEIKSKPKAKILQEFDFTANVHDISLNLENHLVHLDELSSEKSGKQIPPKKDPFGDVFSKKMKNTNIHSLIERKLASKQDYEQGRKELNESLTLPAKDSPMISHFKTPVKKSKDLGSASIVSLTVEEKQSTKSDPGSKSSKEKNPHDAPKKLQNTQLRKYRHKTAQNPVKTKTPKQPPTKAEIIKNNMRFVFPLKGVLIFCAVLGGLAFVTILISIAYAAMKCNKPKSSSKKFHIVNTSTEES